MLLKNKKRKINDMMAAKSPMLKVANNFLFCLFALFNSVLKSGNRINVLFYCVFHWYRFANHLQWMHVPHTLTCIFDVYPVCKHDIKFNFVFRQLQKKKTKNKPWMLMRHHDATKDTIVSNIFHLFCEPVIILMMMKAFWTTQPW